MRFLNTIKNTILEIIFPANCLGCGIKGKFLCRDCIVTSPPADRESPDWTYPIFDYRHPPIKKTLWLLKYTNKKIIAEIFAEIIYDRILEELSELRLIENFTNPIIIPIPLSRKRFKERGYNQVEIICKKIIQLDKKENFKLEKNILIKPTETEHQARIKNKNARMKNIIGSFSLKEGSENTLKGKNIILIDDILTTGATLTEAKKVLKKGGARKVIAFTIAH